MWQRCVSRSRAAPVPEDREPDLIDAMRKLALGRWRWQETNPFGRNRDEDHFYFHRDATGQLPPCTVCVHRTSKGHLIVVTITPDEGAVTKIPLHQYVEILNDFDSIVAEPAAVSVEGWTAGTSKQHLEDHFSPKSVELLERFCRVSNGLGTHPSDQRRWRAFLIQLHREGADVHCDVFGKLLKAKDWWPEDHIPDLVHEYDFAMELLRQYDGRDDV